MHRCRRRAVLLVEGRVADGAGVALGAGKAHIDDVGEHGARAVDRRVASRPRARIAPSRALDTAAACRRGTRPRSARASAAPAPPARARAMRASRWTSTKCSWRLGGRRRPRTRGRGARRLVGSRSKNADRQRRMRARRLRDRRPAAPLGQRDRRPRVVVAAADALAHHIAQRQVAERGDRHVLELGRLGERDGRRSSSPARSSQVMPYSATSPSVACTSARRASSRRPSCPAASTSSVSAAASAPSKSPSSRARYRRARAIVSR